MDEPMSTVPNFTIFPQFVKVACGCFPAQVQYASMAGNLFQASMTTTRAEEKEIVLLI